MYAVYSGLKQIKDAKMRRRTMDCLKRLHPALSAGIPARTSTDTLLLATGNIREFDSGKYGYRSDESYLNFRCAGKTIGASAPKAHCRPIVGACPVGLFARSDGERHHLARIFV